VSHRLLETDDELLDCLRRRDAATIADLVAALGVTATAVRQRLTRVMEAGYVDRFTERQGRGRPIHRYRLTPSGAQASGDNYADLAQTLWEEIRSLPDAAVRKGLLQRIAKRLTERYVEEVNRWPR
jgi:predicted ArsR family transcriptional regulator